MSNLSKYRLFPTLFDVFWDQSENPFYSLQSEPKMDILQTEKDVIVKADIPGITKDDVSIILKNKMITITGEIKKENEEKTTNSFYSERYSGSFSRTLPLPTDVIADKAVANFKDGVLTITIPKSVKGDDGIKIQIN
jgi:HSP20 family protein